MQLPNESFKAAYNEQDLHPVELDERSSLAQKVDALSEKVDELFEKVEILTTNQNQLLTIAAAINLKLEVLVSKNNNSPSFHHLKQIFFIAVWLL